MQLAEAACLPPEEGWGATGFLCPCLCVAGSAPSHPAVPAGRQVLGAEQCGQRSIFAFRPGLKVNGSLETLTQ